MATPRMAQPVDDDRGRYSFALNTHRTPYAPLAASAETVQVVEELAGWAPYQWAVKIDGVTYFVDGTDRPTER